jgi:signal transduction histidine kinase
MPAVMLFGQSTAPVPVATVWHHPRPNRVSKETVMLHSTQFEGTDLGGFAKGVPAMVPMEEYAAGIVHDLGNLIQIAKSAISILGRHKALAGNGTLLPIVERADTSLERAAALVTRTMDRARLHEALALAEDQVTDVGRCIRDVESLIDCLCEPGIEVVLRVESDLPLLGLPLLDLQNVVLNLVINARDAMPDGGLLSIEACRHFDRNFGSGILIAVEDTGVGMSEETMAHACDALFTTKASGRGTGLGLATASRFAIEAGGRLEIASEVGRGTRVQLHLPTPSARNAAITAPETAA